MAFIEPCPAETDCPEVQRIYERQQQAFGYLPNYAPLFSHRPEILDRWAELQRGLKRHVSSRLYELVTFAAAVALKSAYCTLAHGVQLRRFLTDVEIVCLTRQDYDGIVTDAEAVAMRYAAQVALDASAITAQDVQTLRDVGFSDADVFDLAGIAAGRVFFAKLVEGLGAQPDAAYQQLPAPLRCALSVGRGIGPG